MGVKGLNHYLCQSTVASREIVLEEFAKEYKKQHNRYDNVTSRDHMKFWWRHHWWVMLSNTFYSGSHYLCLMVNHFGMCCMGHYPEYLEDNSSNLEKRNRVRIWLSPSDIESSDPRTSSRPQTSGGVIVIILDSDNHASQPKTRPKMSASVSPRWASNWRLSLATHQ